MIIVTGMHKSGTTLISEWLHNSEISMIEHFPLPNKLEYGIGNQYERLSTLNLNNYILKMRNKSSLYIPKKHNYISDDILNAFHSVKKRQKNSWGIKDPRICLILKDYLRIFPETEFIFIFRNPEEVAKRYSLRNKFNIIRALKTWLIYNENIIKFVTDHQLNYSIIEYSDLINNDDLKYKLAKKYKLNITKFQNKSKKVAIDKMTTKYLFLDRFFFNEKINTTYNNLKKLKI